MQYLKFIVSAQLLCYSKIICCVVLMFLPVDECPDDKYLNKYVRERVCAAGTNKWRDLGIVLMAV